MAATKQTGLSLRTVAQAGVLCFTEGGFRLTQVAHVAARMRVSVGSIYRYVDSKEALFEAAALEAAELLDADAALPFTSLPGGSFRRRITDFLAAQARWPILRAASAGGAADAEAVAAELFDLLTRWSSLVRLLERCARDRPDLLSLFEDEIRRPYMDDLEAWARRSATDGPAAGALARGAMEAVSWLAIRRPHDSTGRLIPDAAARAAAITLFGGAFAGAGVS